MPIYIQIMIYLLQPMQLKYYYLERLEIRLAELHMLEKLVAN